MWCASHPYFPPGLVHLADHPSAHRVAALADREAEPGLERDGGGGLESTGVVCDEYEDDGQRDCDTDALEPDARSNDAHAVGLVDPRACVAHASEPSQSGDEHIWTKEE